MKNILKIISFTCLLMVLSLVVYAQGPGFDPDVQPYAAPLDGGAGLLIAGGVLLVIRKLRKVNNSSLIN